MTYELHYQAHMQGLEHHSLRSMATQGTFPRTSIQTAKYPNCQLSDDIFFGQIFSGYLPNPKITKTSGVRWVLGAPLLGLGGSTEKPTVAAITRQYRQLDLMLLCVVLENPIAVHAG